MRLHFWDFKDRILYAGTLFFHMKQKLLATAFLAAVLFLSASGCKAETPPADEIAPEQVEQNSKVSINIVGDAAVGENSAVTPAAKEEAAL